MIKYHDCNKKRIHMYVDKINSYGKIIFLNRKTIHEIIIYCFLIDIEEI